MRINREDETAITRRCALKAIGTAAFAVTVGGDFANRLSSASAGADEGASLGEQVKPVIPNRAEHFELENVRLFAGPFNAAQERDANYLSSLKPESQRTGKIPSARIGFPRIDGRAIFAAFSLTFGQV